MEEIASALAIGYFLSMQKVNLAEAFASFSQPFQPRIIGELNGQHLQAVKVHGEFVWHHHEAADEMFFVVKGALTIQLRDRDVELREGELFIIPRGVEHRPVAEEEAQVLLFEPAGTLNTGNVQNERTFVAVRA